MDANYIIMTAVLIAVFIGLFCIGTLFISRALKNFSGRRHSEFKPLISVQRNYDRIRRISRIPCGVLYIMAQDGEVNTVNISESSGSGYRRLEETVLALFDGRDDMVARLTSKEFIVLTRMSESKLTSVTEQIRQDLTLFCKSHSDTAPIKICFGAYLIPASNIDFEETIARAKLACVQAKGSTRSYVAWDYGLQVDYENRKNLEKDLSSGVENNNFFLEFQPVIDLRSGNIMGGEVLSRLNSKSGVFFPSDFVPVVRDKNMETEFDTFVFEKTCRWISMHADACRYLNYISVNLSRNTLSFDNLAESLLGIIEKYAVKKSLIAIEVLEEKSDYEHDADNIGRNLRTLKNAGLTILLDDFGDGYSSFDDLKNYPVDAIKISKSVTANIGSQIGLRIFKSLVNVAKNLKVQIICEGAETLEQIELLKSTGVTYVQGYYFCKPVGPDQFEKAIINNRTKKGDM